MKVCAIFLASLLPLCASVFFGDRASAAEVGQRGFIQGVGCLTPEDVEKVVPVVIKSESMMTVAIEAAKEKIGCGPFVGQVTYKGIAKTFIFGNDGWAVIWFQTDDGTNVYSWKRIPGEDA